MTKLCRFKASLAGIRRRKRGTSGGQAAGRRPAAHAGVAGRLAPHGKRDGTDCRRHVSQRRRSPDGRRVPLPVDGHFFERLHRAGYESARLARVDARQLAMGSNPGKGGQIRNKRPQSAFHLWENSWEMK